MKNWGKTAIIWMVLFGFCAQNIPALAPEHTIKKILTSWKEDTENNDLLLVLADKFTIKVPALVSDFLENIYPLIFNNFTPTEKRILLEHGINLFKNILPSTEQKHQIFDILNKKMQEAPNNLAILRIYLFFLMNNGLSPEQKLTLADKPIYLDFISQIQKADLTNAQEKQKIIDQICVYLNQQAQEYKQIKDILNLSNEKRDLKFKELCILCLLLDYLTLDSVSKKHLFIEINYILKNANIDSQNNSPDSYVLDANLMACPEKLAEHGQESFYVFLWFLSHERGHRNLHTKKIFSSKDVMLLSLHDAFADVTAFSTIETITKTNPSLKTAVIKDILRIFYHSSLKSHFYERIYMHPDCPEKTSKELEALKQRGLIKEMPGNKALYLSIFNKSKKDLGEHLYNYYFYLLLAGTPMGAEYISMSRFSLYRLFKFLYKDYFDLRWCTAYPDNISPELIEALKEKNILKSNKYNIMFMRFSNLEHFKDCQTETDFLEKIQNILGEKLELNATIKALFAALKLLREKPPTPTYTDIANAMTKTIPVLKKKEDVSFISLLIKTLKNMGVNIKQHIKNPSYFFLYNSGKPDTVFSMSLVSNWREILEQKQIQEQRAKQGLENNLHDYMPYSISAALIWSNLDALTAIDENLFSTLTQQEKLSMVLSFLKVCLGNSELYESLKNKALNFFTQKFMPNLADTDAKQNITICEKTFACWRTLTAELLHELIHIAKKEKSEIENYKELSILLKQIFIPEDQAKFIKNLSDMKNEHRHPLFETYENVSQLSYPIILDKLLKGDLDEEMEKAVIAFMTINRNA